MRYCIRAVKYFFYFCFLTTAILTVLAVCGIVDKDVQTMFRNGYDSIWQIAIMFALLSAIYPKFGWQTRSVRLPGTLPMLKDKLKTAMEEHGFKLESDTTSVNEEGVPSGVMTFRRRDFGMKLLRMWEDRITFTQSEDGIAAEGLRKDLAALIMYLEHKFNSEE
ncbi:MAG: hypothetical protein MJY67_03045 [Bacteroidales bacterium]|nr:hypothetical protein [Bacteroidales bacterium]